MAFWGDYFVYDGIPCTEFGLRLYEVNGVTPGEAKFSVASDISEDRVSSRYRPLFYGVTQNEPLSFKMVFGADKELANSGGFFDAWDREAISSWLSPLDVTVLPIPATETQPLGNDSSFNVPAESLAVKRRSWFSSKSRDARTIFAFNTNPEVEQPILPPTIE